MELQLVSVKARTPIQKVETVPFSEYEIISTGKPFIEANTVEITVAEIQHHHIIPVFIRDNETAISHSEFIEITQDVVAEAYRGEVIYKPSVRLSHPIKGRIPEAKNKPAIELLEHEKTIYYERMAFIIEVPTVFTDVAGNRLNLTVGGVKAYNLDNLTGKSNAEQHFKIFVGFQNKVCTNLCVSSDGYIADLKVKSQNQLRQGIRMLLEEYNAIQHAATMNSFQNYELTEQQFAQLIGRCRMYSYLPTHQKVLAGSLQFGDSHINTVCRDYYSDNSFCSNPDGSINLWRLFNLFTGANKNSYIDTFLDRGLNAYELTRELKQVLDKKATSWFLN